MPKVALVQVVYKTKHFIPQVFPAALKQTHSDCEFYAVIASNEDGAKDYIQQHFPEVKIIDPGYNIGFSKGHNDLFKELDVDFFQLINPDLIITETFVEEMLRPFEDKTVGAVSGKILQYDFKNDKPTNIIDTTGVTIAKSGRGRDRGQHEVDTGQYDNHIDLVAVSGAAAMYRKAALMDVAYQRPDGRSEFFDEDFFMYWEDVDLSWRMVNRGWKIKYNPKALAYHGRTAASSPKGYSRVWSFIKHHRNISRQILQWNYKNHIFMFIKNSSKWYWQFFVRELFYNIFVLVFETKTFKVLPTFYKQLPLMWKKRQYIKKTRQISAEDMQKLLV